MNLPIKPIKVAGYGAVTACGETVSTSCNAILAGQSGITIPTGSTYPQAHIKLDCVPGERAFSLASMAIEQAIKDFPPSHLPQTALIVSTAKGEISQLESQARGKPLTFEYPQETTAKLAQKFGLAATPFTVSNACASGLIALAQGMRLLLDDDFDHVLVAGVDLCTDFVVSGFGCLRALSDQFTRPYDSTHCGLNLGEGAGAVLLTKDQALKALGYLEGYGISNDANHITGPSRTGDGLAAAMQKALTMAGVTPDQVQLLNGHGTGTKYNDDMELLAINTVFRDNKPLFSYKGYIGHTIGAAGVIEAALTLELLRQQRYPASLGFNDNPNLPEVVSIPTRAQSDINLERAFAFKAGFGGVNAALLLKRGDFSNE